MESESVKLDEDGCDAPAAHAFTVSTVGSPAFSGCTYSTRILPVRSVSMVAAVPSRSCWRDSVIVQPALDDSQAICPYEIVPWLIDSSTALAAASCSNLNQASPLGIARCGTSPLAARPTANSAVGFAVA